MSWCVEKNTWVDWISKIPSDKIKLIEDMCKIDPDFKSYPRIDTNNLKVTWYYWSEKLAFKAGSTYSDLYIPLKWDWNNEGLRLSSWSYTHYTHGWGEIVIKNIIDRQDIYWKIYPTLIVDYKTPAIGISDIIDIKGIVLENFDWFNVPLDIYIPVEFEPYNPFLLNYNWLTKNFYAISWSSNRFELPLEWNWDPAWLRLDGLFTDMTYTTNNGWSFVIKSFGNKSINGKYLPVIDFEYQAPNDYMWDQDSILFTNLSLTDLNWYSKTFELNLKFDLQN